MIGLPAAGGRAAIDAMRASERIGTPVTPATDLVKYPVVPQRAGTSRRGFDARGDLQNPVDAPSPGHIVWGLIETAAFACLVVRMMCIGCGQATRAARKIRGVGCATEAAVVPDAAPILAATCFPIELIFRAGSRFPACARRSGCAMCCAGWPRAVAARGSLAMIGGSGPGPSVPPTCTLGLGRIDAGRIRRDGQDAGKARRTAVLARFGMLLRGGALSADLPVRQKPAVRPARGRTPRDRARAVALARFARVGLGPAVADPHPARLPGGRQKRGGLARAIAADPEGAFLDHIAAGLAPIVSGVPRRPIGDTVAETGAAGVTATPAMTIDRATMPDERCGRGRKPRTRPDTGSGSDLPQAVHGRSGTFPWLR